MLAKQVRTLLFIEFYIGDLERAQTCCVYVEDVLKWVDEGSPLYVIYLY